MSHRRWIGIVVLLAILVSGSPVPTTAQDASPTASSPVAASDIDGRFDIGDGRSLYLHCTGTGTLTVILESGWSDSSSAWDAVTPELATATRVCAYDRAGTGQSDPPPGPYPRTFQATVDDLHALLLVAHVPGPYVLVGHSIGGMIVQLFASTFPTDVVGLVLVDGTPPGNFAASNALLDEPVRMEDDQFNRGVSSGDMEQFDLYASENLVAASHLLPRSPIRVPTIVLTHETLARDLGFLPADTLAAVERVWSAQQVVQADVLQGALIVAEGTGHQIHRERPDIVIDAILEVIALADASKGPATPAAQ